jgi:hypothetical protein
MSASASIGAAPVEATASHATRPPRTTASAPERVDLTAAAQEVSRQCTRSDGRSFTLYTQIYDERQRDPALRLLAMVRPLGIVVPGVENVTATAKRKQNKPPIPWMQPTLLYGPEGKACAQALSRWMSGYLGATQALPLPSFMASSGSVIELWVPQSTSASAYPPPAENP